MKYDLKTFNKEAIKNRKKFRTFIGRLETSRHQGILAEVIAADKEVWQDTNCLKCANCCKKMTPTLKAADKKKIAAHLGLSIPAFTRQYLEYDNKDKNWRMQQQPCVFLDLKTNKCKIYPVRPADCSGFPHIKKTPLKSYLYIHKQNIMYCPATYLFIEKMMERVGFENT